MIDECSMVDAELGRDLMSFDCPLLVLGDPAQLPPIQGGGFFTDCEPDAMLTEVHRQAQDDPIVRMSMDVREGRDLDIGRYGESEVVSRNELDPDRVMSADQVLVGRNNTRRAYNMRVRQKQNIEDPLPVAGDKLVCLRNNRKKGLFNGGLWRVKSRAASKSKIITMRLIARRGFRPQGDEGLGARRLLRRRHRDASRGSSASPMTSSTTATCSPCTNRRARNGTTWCCSTRALRSRTAAPDGSTPASRARRNG